MNVSNQMEALPSVLLRRFVIVVQNVTDSHKALKIFFPQYFLENRIDSRLQVNPAPESCLRFECLLELERETAWRPIGRGLCRFCALAVSVSLGEEACGNGAAAHSVPCVHWAD